MTGLSVPLDLPGSVWAGRMVSAKIGGCWLNAFRSLSFSCPALYVEGYAVAEIGIPFEHGWLVPTPDGVPSVVIDPTLFDFQERGIDVPVRYVPAMVWSAEDCILQASNQKVLPLGMRELFHREDRITIDTAWRAALAEVFREKG